MEREPPKETHSPCGKYNLGKGMAGMERKEGGRPRGGRSVQRGVPPPRPSPPKDSSFATGVHDQAGLPPEHTPPIHDPVCRPEAFGRPTLTRGPEVLSAGVDTFIPVE